MGEPKKSAGPTTLPHHPRFGREDTFPRLFTGDPWHSSYEAEHPVIAEKFARDRWLATPELETHA